MRFSLTVLALALVSTTAVLAQPTEQGVNGLGNLKSTINPGVQNKVKAVLSGSGKSGASTGGASSRQKRHEPDHSSAHDEDQKDDGDEGDEGDEEDEDREEHHGRDP